MDQGLRTTASLTAKIEGAQSQLIKHYEALMKLVGTPNPSRNTTAIMQYRMQVETAAVIRAGEELQLLIRQMQEMWLFGQLNTIGESKVQQQADENAKAVGDLLNQVLELRSWRKETQESAAAEAVGSNGT